MGFSKGSSEMFFNISYGTVQGGAKLVRQAKFPDFKWQK